MKHTVRLTVACILLKSVWQAASLRSALTALLLVPLTALNAATPLRAETKPRLAVLTDIGGDPDDQQSMIRLMVYANEFEIEALIASASGTRGELKKAITRPDLIREIIDAYEQVLPNLKRHATGWPEAEQLRLRVKPGNPQRGRNASGEGHDTEASRLLIERIDTGSPERPLNIAIWGGQTDLAQALWRVKRDRGATGLAGFVRKFRVYDINDQDGIADWMRAEFPGMFYVLATAAVGRDKREGTYRGMYLTGDESLTSREWIEKNVRSTGPLGALYPTKTWTAPNKNSCLKEGDTPAWFFFLPLGGNDPNDPAKPGWGGQFKREPDGWWRDLPSKDGFDPRATVSRWRPDFQRDFAKRMAWCRSDQQDQPLPRLRVSDNGRFLVTESGKPFFWLGDTAWQLIHDLNEAELRRYFADRRDKGFTVIQTVALVELRSDTPNAYGHLPIEPKRPDKPIVKDGPDNDYWDDVERVLRLAKEHGLYVGLLPTWGKYVTSSWQSGLVDGFFTVANAESYGRFIGFRFKDHTNVIWILGGDKAAPTDESRAIWRAMVRGIAIGVCGAEDYSKVLMTYHTSGPGSTAWFLNDEPWLDFHALQSGHGRWAMNWLMVEHAYTMKPTLPVIDLETSYPGFRHGRPPTTATDDDARRAAYWAVFAGAAGHTYGHHSIWQMHSPKYPGVAGPKEFWYDALNAPSARQMGHLRRLIESRRFLSQRPDLSLLAFEQRKPWEMCLALRGDGYAMVYSPFGKPFKVRMNKKVKASWFDPRTGKMTAMGEFVIAGEREFTPPTSGENNDWVLVLDDAAKDFAPPGQQRIAQP
ncbi:MAG: DUF4038 domain-containing protein [Verrucomicrobia bacterium]|nr:DUF4038 domain-containing protein [Verrucomicrobiota bacterium]